MLHGSLRTYNLVNDDKIYPDKLVNYNQVKSKIKNTNVIGEIQLSEITDQEPLYVLLVNYSEKKSQIINPVLLVKYS